MERIEFNYTFDDNEEQAKTVVMELHNEDGITDSAVCEMFEDFMRSVGYSTQNVVNYFRD